MPASLLNSFTGSHNTAGGRGAAHTQRLMGRLEYAVWDLRGGSPREKKRKRMMRAARWRRWG